MRLKARLQSTTLDVHQHVPEPMAWSDHLARSAKAKHHLRWLPTATPTTTLDMNESEISFRYAQQHSQHGYDVSAPDA